MQGTSIRKFIRKNACDQSGQMSIEFVIAFPVMLMIALILCNACLCTSECAAFDRLSKDAIRTFGTSPSYEQRINDCAVDIQNHLSTSFEKDYLSVDVQAEQCASNQVRYVAHLNFYPTLFGRTFSGNVFGIQITPISHESSLVVQPYQPISF